MTITQCLETLLKDGFILVFNQNKLDVVRTAQALLDAGIHNMEITCRVSRPLEKVDALRKALPEFCIGVASLIDSPPALDAYNRTHVDDPLPSVLQVVDNGADYLVSAAGFRPESYKAFGKNHVMIPGCSTPSEILREYGMGAHLCKLFPAKEIGGLDFIKAVDPPLHQFIGMIPMGGTRKDNMGQLLSAGVMILGASFSILSNEVLQWVIDEQDYKLLAKEMKEVKAQFDASRAERWPALDFAKATLADISAATGRHFNV